MSTALDLKKRQFPSVFDNTGREDWHRCPKKFEYRIVRGLQDLNKSVDLHAGGALAAGLEKTRRVFFEQGQSSREAVDAGVVEVYRFYGEFKCPVNSTKTAGKMAGALISYFDHYKLGIDPFEPLVDGIEHRFQLRLSIDHPQTGEKMFYGGRFDLLAADRTNKEVWVVDEKSTKADYRIGSVSEAWLGQWELDSQMTGYIWAAKQLMVRLGLDPNRVQGARVRGIAIGKAGYDHVEVIVKRQDWELDRWYEEMMEDVKEAVQAEQNRSFRLALGHACHPYGSPCEFAKLCAARDPERLIEGNYRQEFWLPAAKERR
ncbi:MAG: PD-(D/E)XK nuclease family protein [Candidatus Dormibacteria bacterium]